VPIDAALAEEPFLGPRTVETHVRNIFGKLGASSRAPLWTPRVGEEKRRTRSVDPLSQT
jgi:DNA-binding NarL/FixJ family response regulator